LLVISIPDNFDGFIEMQPCCEGSGKSKMMKNGQLFRVVEKNCYDLEERIKDMDKTGSVSKFIT